MFVDGKMLVVIGNGGDEFDVLVGLGFLFGNIVNESEYC